MRPNGYCSASWSARYYRVVSLHELVAAQADGCPLPANSVALTFDDAFANVFTNARPLLREYGMPYTVAIPMGLVNSEETVWSLAVRLMLLCTRLPSLKLPNNNHGETVTLNTRGTSAWL